MPVIFADGTPSVKSNSLDRSTSPRRSNTPEEDAMVLALRAALHWMDKVSDQHDEAHPDKSCWCGLCKTIQGLYWTVEAGEALLNSDMLPVPEYEPGNVESFIEVLTQFDAPIVLDR